MIPIAKPLLGSEEKKAVAEVIDSGMIAFGPKTKEFEKKFAEYVDVKHAVATPSGTTALHLGLLSMDVGSGDEVILPSFSFIASANAVLFCGAKPVFCDVDKDTFNIDPLKVKELISEKTKAIMPVHLYGQAADMNPLLEIAETHGVSIIGDACQAHGAVYNGQTVGSFGDLECFSFYPTKNMTTGEGGMVTTDEDILHEQLLSLRNHGRVQTQWGYEHDRVGYNYRMTDLAAAIGLVQLQKLPKFIEKRRENAMFYDNHLHNVKTPVVLDESEHVYHQYTIQYDNRETLMERLKKEGIGFGIYYPKSLHQYPHLKPFAHSDLKNSEYLASVSLSLPVHPAIAEQDLETVVSVVNEVCQPQDR
jgi:dTDP-4-amino-4,6-dideoxygalactose transaminase